MEFLPSSPLTHSLQFEARHFPFRTKHLQLLLRSWLWMGRYLKTTDEVELDLKLKPYSQGLETIGQTRAMLVVYW